MRLALWWLLVYWNSPKYIAILVEFQGISWIKVVAGSSARVFELTDLSTSLSFDHYNSEFNMFWRMAGLSTASPVSVHDFILIHEKCFWSLCVRVCFIIGSSFVVCCFLAIEFDVAEWFAYIGVFLRRDEQKQSSSLLRRHWSFAWFCILLANMIWEVLLSHLDWMHL